MECSNKGICDRISGSCQCFPGYDGSSCQRASCPTRPVYTGKKTAGKVGDEVITLHKLNATHSLTMVKKDNGAVSLQHRAHGETGGATSGMADVMEDKVCSGHGTCESISDYAKSDYDNIYKLWDKDASMICNCDPGYYGAACSMKSCKYGFDPLYSDDDKATVRYSNWTYVIYAAPTSGDKVQFQGNYSIRFYDVSGKPWLTDVIDIGATCDDVVAALEGLPNRLVPPRSVRCLRQSSSYAAGNSFETTFDKDVQIGARYIIAFPMNPGKLRQPEIVIYTDGKRPTLFTDETVTSTLGVWVYANGFTGEFKDYVPDLCDGVTVTLTRGAYYHTLSGLTTATTKLLKKCLGDADGNTDQTGMANEIYNWDHGTIYNPHVVKLVDSTTPQVTTICNSEQDFSTTSSTGKSYGTCYQSVSAGFYVALFFEDEQFKLLNPAAKDFTTASAPTSTNTFHVFTTTGTLQMTSEFSDAFTVSQGMTRAQRISNFHSSVLYTTNSSRFQNNPAAIDKANGTYLGNVDCETNTVGQNGLLACLNKEDIVMVFNPDVSDSNNVVRGAAGNPRYLNMYTVKKISRERKSLPYPIGGQENDRNRFRIQLDSGTNGYYSYGDIAHDAYSQSATYARIYKFTPPVGVEYAAECATRGLCNTDTGLCECFRDSAGDDCSVMSSSA